MVKREGSAVQTPLLIKHVKKRDGTVVNYDRAKIEKAITFAVKASGEGNGNSNTEVTQVALGVEQDLVKAAERMKERGIVGEYVPDIEEIQPIVESNLLRSGLKGSADHYINYREQRSRVRNLRQRVDPKVRELVRENKKFFRTPLSEYVFFSRYSRFDEEKGRREVWTESVDRYVGFLKETLDGRLEEDKIAELRDSILHQRTMPSMRLLWSAGKAARKTNVAAYNCAYTTPTELKDFGEIFYTLMCGTGVGFSVENRFVGQLPIVAEQKGERQPVHVVGDSKEGWAEALVTGLQAWYAGRDLDFDFTKVRPAGARLHTMGGRSSGPESLKKLLNYSRAKVLSRQDRRLTSLDVHDLLCNIGESVIVGGVRRSALLSLSDLDDLEMRTAKSGNWYNEHPERQLANNSATYNSIPTDIQFMEEWLSLVKSKSGERGIFNRAGVNNQLPQRRLDWVKKYDPALVKAIGANPCVEIYLFPRQFCNLTSVTGRADDTRASLLKKVEIAVLNGTIQSMLTNFEYLGPKWKEMCEQERLLGVSLNGVMDCPLLRDPEFLVELREHAKQVQFFYADKFGINRSNAITCVKPEGTNSLLVDCSPGFHTREAHDYIRHVGLDNTDPIMRMLQDQKYPIYSRDNSRNFIIPFAVESPRGSITKDDLDVIQQLEIWKNLKLNYTEHNPSASIYVGRNEWVTAGQWVKQNFPYIGGLSFFPKDEGEHIYKYPPQQKVTPEERRRLAASLPVIDFADLTMYETEDTTAGAREYACAGGACTL